MGGLINALTIMIALTWGLLVACLATLVFLPLLANLPFLAVLPQEILASFTPPWLPSVPLCGWREEKRVGKTIRSKCTPSCAKS